MMYELGRDPMTNYVECLECGTDTITDHVIGCNTGTGMYLIVKGDGIIGHAFNEHVPSIRRDPPRIKELGRRTRLRH